MYKTASTDLCQILSNKIKEPLSKCHSEAFVRSFGVLFEQKLGKKCQTDEDHLNKIHIYIYI